MSDPSPKSPPAAPSDAPTDAQTLTDFGDALQAIVRDPHLRDLLLAADLVAVASNAAADGSAEHTKLLAALDPAFRSLEDELTRRALLVDYLQIQVRKAAECITTPLVPWDVPRERATDVDVNPDEAGAERYRWWLIATLADLARHFARAVSNEVEDKSAAASNLAIARMLRAATLAFLRGNGETLEKLAEPARRYLQELDSPKDDVRFEIPDRASVHTTSVSQTRHGDPPGSVVVIPAGDVVESKRHEAAVLFCKALELRLRDGYSEEEVASIRRAFPTAATRPPGPLSNEEIARGAWAYFKTPELHPIVKDLPAPLPLEPDATLVAKLTRAVATARRDPAATGGDAEDTAERIFRALLRALDYPAEKVRSVLDPLRKKPAES